MPHQPVVTLVTTNLLYAVAVLNVPNPNLCIHYVEVGLIARNVLRD